MTPPVSDKRWRRVATFGLGYFGLGVASAMISNPLRPGLGQASIRVGVLLAAIVLFYVHGRIEIASSPESLRKPVFLSSGAVACGTFLLAVYAVTAAWWETSTVPWTLLSALLIWPVVTGVLALLGGLTVVKLMKMARRGTERT
ncbi:MAG: hypothetical protein OEO79_16785 [Gemmatimonadota bacterium]|nr:hypothetical protein [Gemmatimonadota bacterium]